jgi:predicted dehydrogenase
MTASAAGRDAARGSDGHRVPRLGFLGLGWIGRHRMKAVKESGAAKIVAVADAVPERARAAAAEVPGALVVNDLDALLAQDLDGIVIATPSALHAEQSLAALATGAAVFCQKPLGRNAREVRAVVDAARRADRRLGADFCYRHVRGVDALREEATSGALGTIVAVDAVFHNAYGPEAEWFRDPARSGGGCLMDLGIHLVDLVDHVLGSPRVTGAWARLHAGGRRLEDPRLEVEDLALAALELQGGAVARIACSWNLHAGRDAHIAFEVYGTRGGGALRNVNGSFYDFVVDRFDGTRRTRLAEPPDAWGGRAIVAWARALASSPRYDAAAERWVEVAGTLDALYEAAAAEAPVSSTAAGRTYSSSS